ncbi:Phage capsid family protein [Roseovarius litorisediminis]|uniref:Phage capsid family protein n=1 Tax=Roseovarius litorisediminis TaxID=1312363 RepID=A0A1Y5TF07_9RHOB|nr:phage major capsid protein [Roseovarius litorisediminis]SLN62357.1 Phage capsid family protein [Roseovarius litorisediminis]
MSERIEIKAQLSVTETGEITGIAWPFGTPDRVGDVIEKGAFTAPDTLPMLFAHDQNQVVGVWDQISESSEGLTVKGRLLVEDVERAREVRAMIRSKAVSGLSIGFVTKSAKRHAKGRTISAAQLHEISIVAIPCHPGAQITSLKSDDTPNSSKENPHVENEENENELEAQTPANDAPQVDLKAFNEIKARLDRMEAKSNRPQGVHIIAPADKPERKAFDAFLRRGVERISPDEVKALTISTATSGGYLAPEEFGGELIKLLNEFSPIRKYARVVNISAPDIIYPRRVSGTAATWVTETANRTESGMTFEQVKLTPHELATFTDVSNQLLEDNAYNLEGELLADFAESFAKTEGLAFVNGSGTEQPTGIMTATGIPEIKTGAADGFLGNPTDLIISMFHQIATTHAQNAVWVMNRNTLAILRQSADTSGRYLLIDPISEGAPATLLGRPIVEMTDMDDIAAGSAPILFGDMTGYRIVDRIGLSTMRDPYALATNGQVRFHARKRVGADLTHPDRFIKLRVAA